MCLRRTPGKRSSEVLGSASIVAAAINNVLQHVDIKSEPHDTSSITLCTFVLWPQKVSLLQLPISSSPFVLELHDPFRYEYFRPRPHVQRFSSHTDPASPRSPDRGGHLRRYTLKSGLDSDGRPTSGTANDDVALQHASRTRSPLLRKGDRSLP